MTSFVYKRTENLIRSAKHCRDHYEADFGS
jgi:hypothetical protein